MNAKLLLLGKINATTDTSKMYAALVSLGFSPSQIVKFMLNDTMSDLISFAEQDVFDRENDDVGFNTIVKDIKEYYNSTDKKDADKKISAKYSGKKLLSKLKNKKFKEEFMAISEIIDIADEFSIIGSIFSINNGIKSTPYDMYAFDEKIKKYFKDIDFPIDFDDFVIDLYKSENGDKKAEKRVNQLIELYDITKKKAFNVFATIRNNKHYVSQLVVNVIAKREIDASIPTLKAANYIITNMAYDGVFTGKLNNKQYNSVSQYVDDAIAAQYIENNPDYFKVHIPAGEFIASNGTSRVVGKGGLTLDLSDPMQRQTFMVWFNNSVVPNLKLRFPNISFIKDLRPNDVMDIMNGVRIPYVDLAIDTTNFHNPNVEKCFAQYISDFKKLENEDIMGNKFKDLMFIYNFILTRNSGKKGSWSRLLPIFFKVGDNEDNILSNWNKYLIQLGKEDIKGGFLGDVELNEVTLLSNYALRTIRNARGENEGDDPDAEEQGDNDDQREFDMDDDMSLNEKPDFKAKYQRGEDGIVGVEYNKLKLYPDGYNAYLPIKGRKIITPQLSLRTEAGSKRILYQTIDRMKELNPNISIEIIDNETASRMIGEVGSIHMVRAFIKDGVVYINEDAASGGDVIHEFGHIALESIKQSDNELFNYIIEAAKNHPLYAEISELYSHITNEEEFAEEVFMRLVGDIYENGAIKKKEQSWYNSFKGVVNKFINFVKGITESLFGNKIEMNANDLMGLSIEEIAKRFGDDIIKKSLPKPIIRKTGVSEIIDKLMIDNLLKIKCNG